MRTYTVVVTDTAAADLAESFAYIQARSLLNAERWLREAYAAAAGLETLPGGYAPARESEFLGLPLRQKIFKSHLIVFSIDEPQSRVTVLYVRHSARRAVGEPDEPDAP